MSAKIIDGTAVAATLKADVQQRVRQWSARGRQIQLTAIVVGGTRGAFSP